MCVRAYVLVGLVSLCDTLYRTFFNDTRSVTRSLTISDRKQVQRVRTETRDAVRIPETNLEHCKLMCYVLHAALCGQFSLVREPP